MDDDLLLVGGAAFGTLCSQLYERVDSLVKNSEKVNNLPGQIKETLDSLEALSHKKQDHKNDRETEKFHVDRIANGVKLLDACLEDPKWHYKFEYTKKLNDLDDSLKIVGIQLLLSAADQGEIKNEDVERLLPVAVRKQQPDPAISDIMDETMKLANKLKKVVLMPFVILAVITMAIWVINITFRVSSAIKVVDEFMEYHSWFGDMSAAETNSYGGKLLLVTSRRALLFLAFLGVLLAMIFIDVAKLTVYALLFVFSLSFVVASAGSVRNLYRRGFSWSGFQEQFFWTVWAAYFLYICVLLFISEKCHCKSLI